MSYEIYSQLVREIVCTQPDRLDISLLNSDLRDAYYIHLESLVHQIARRQNHSGSKTIVDFNEVRDAFPPLTNCALFVEFSAQSAMYEGNNIGHFGFHLVNWNICKKASVAKGSIMTIGKHVEIEECYGLTMYFHRDKNIFIHPVISFIGLDKVGRLILQEDTWLHPQSYHHFRFCLSRYRRQFAWYKFLIFSSFAGINSGLFALHQEGEKRWAGTIR